jgi:hypothetical protein
MSTTAPQHIDADHHRESRDQRAARWERRLALPVIIAAVVAVPAVFLTAASDVRYAMLGTALNWASLAVLTGEAVVLFILTGPSLRADRSMALPAGARRLDSRRGICRRRTRRSDLDDPPAAGGDGRAAGDRGGRAGRRHFRRRHVHRPALPQPPPWT